jgi:hypothetical protein
MNLEEAEDLQNTIIEIVDIFRNIPKKKITECLKMYVSIRKKYTREELIEFVRVNIDLHNL